MKGSVTKKLEDQHLEADKARSVQKNHWKLERDRNDILWAAMDKKDSSANTISREILLELNDILDDVERNKPKALVIHSLKKAGFCAGADIKQFVELEPEDMKTMLQKGHGVLDRLEALSIPTIAVIHGHCLGGGLELALACDMRIGVKDGGLQIGFPEVMLGLHPGLGGTFRLTQLIDPVQAMTMMLTGKPAFDKQALKRGLIDDFVEERHVKSAALAAANGDTKPHDHSWKDGALNSMAGRKIAARKMRSESEKKAPSRHYPAPYALIDLWEEYGGDPKTMQKKELESFTTLLKSDTAQNLIRVFFLRQSLKDLTKAQIKVNHVHVIGAGAMGGDIAAWCAMQGLRVTLSDQKAAPIGEAMKAAVKLCKDKHKSSIETRDTLDRLIPDLRGDGIAHADIIIEAVPEKMEIKEKVYEMVQQRMKKGAILATNTSSIPLEDLAKVVKDPARFIGLHFFNPVPKMMVVEVVRHNKTGKNVYEEGLSFAGMIGKLPAPVKSYPGFLVNRALVPYMTEAIIMLDEGENKERIDKAAKDFGMPMGPVELADQVGLDICVDVADKLAEKLDTPMVSIPDWLRAKVEKGELGKKSGKGFYTWEKGKAKHDDFEGSAPDQELTDRLILPMLNACVECYREGVIDNPDHLDGAMIFATGFAPFRGGPIHYAKNRGVDDIIDALEKLAEKHGERFKPDQGWKDI